MRCLVTGGSGFLGTYMVKLLAKKGHKVRIFDIVEPEAKGKNIEFIKGDITNYNQIYKACKNIDWVFHTVALVPLSKAGRRFIDVNVGGTEKLLRACLELKVKKIIHISTSSVYEAPNQGPLNEQTPFVPIGQYGRAKLKSENVCREYRKKGLDIIIIRPRTILGTTRLGIFQILFDWIKRNKLIYIMGNGRNIIQFISAGDVAEFCLLVTKVSNEDFNIGSDSYSSLEDILEILIKHAGSKSKIVRLPAGLTRLMLQLLDIIGLSPLAEWHYKTYDKSFYFDNIKAKKMLGWKAKDKDIDMMLDSYEWYIKHAKHVDGIIGTTHKTSPNQKILKILRFFS